MNNYQGKVFYSTNPNQKFGFVFSYVLIYSFREDFLVKSAKKTVKIFTNK